ncbi:MAG: nuclear transport factor 2 family protein [Actinomycetota bacterium]|nr:nuclear transport factor 2 family protein [Actinomycetota bacterium]
MQSSIPNDVSCSSCETVAAFYDAFARGDVDAAISLLTDDIDWYVNGPAPVAGVYRGKAEVLAFFPRMMGQYDWTLQVDVVAVLAEGSHATVRVAERAERPGDGVAYSGVHAWELRDGRCCRFESLYNDAYTEFWSTRRGEVRTAA